MEVRTGEPLAGTAEHLRAGNAEGKRTVATQEIPPDLAGQTHAARQLVDGDRIAHPVRHPGDVMILQIGTDGGNISQHLDAD